MIPAFRKDGSLPVGIHETDWREFSAHFGTSPQRRGLLLGLQLALHALKSAGCATVYLDGSFVTAKVDPADYDGCWDSTGVDQSLLDPVFLDFANKREKQKNKYFGEFFPASDAEGSTKRTWLEFFQRDKAGGAKGIVKLSLGNFP